jgi:hypothetical protein
MRGLVAFTWHSREKHPPFCVCTGGPRAGDTHGMSNLMQLIHVWLPAESMQKIASEAELVRTNQSYQLGQANF